MSDLDLRADCARCAALCCVAFHFDRSEDFAIDKAAGKTCPHLAGAGHCGIYGRRIQRGFRGCVGYDCHGAGQWVTQVLFKRESWLETPALLAPMTEAFLKVERARRLLALLREAAKLDLSPADRRRIAILESAVREAASSLGSVADLEAEASLFLRTLRRYVAGE